MPTAEVLTYKTRNGILKPVPVILSGNADGPPEPEHCPYCTGNLRPYKENYRCYNSFCPSSGATPEDLHKALGPTWMHPFYTYYATPELLIYACYIYGAIAIPLKANQFPGYTIVILAQNIQTIANVAYYTGANQEGFTMPVRRSEEEILSEIKARPNYHYHE
jgi:hypothetical protein